MTDPASRGPGWALVTGASGGLGADMARELAARGFPLVLTARSADLLAELARALGDDHGTEVRVVPMDLSRPGAGDALADTVQAMGIRVEALVNNAGFGQWGHWLTLDPDEEAAMLRLNVEALTTLTRRLAPAMVAEGCGRVLNVASVAGFFPGPLMSVYYATKAYVVSFSEALREELSGTGVTVTCLCPGPVPTRFQERASLHLPRGAVPGLVESPRVARAGIEGLLRGRARVVPGLFNKLSVLMPRFLPRALVPKLVHAIQARRTQRGDG